MGGTGSTSLNSGPGSGADEVAFPGRQQSSYSWVETPEAQRLIVGVIGPGIVLLSLGYLFVATFPGLYLAMGTGLDPSWIHAINVLPGSGYRFGTDVVFTYGPLGYLLAPLDVGSNLVQAGILWVVTQFLFGAVLVYHYRRTGNPIAIVVFSATYLVALSLNVYFAYLFYEYRLLLLVGLLLTVRPEDKGFWRFACVVVAALVGAMLFMKFSGGVASLSMLCIAAIMWIRDRRTSLREVGTFLGGPLLVVCLVLSVTLLGSPANLARWIRLSLEVANGYGSAMSRPGPTRVVLLGLVAVATYGLMAILLRKRERGAFTSALIFAGAVLVAFKHAYVRQQGMLFFAFLLGVVAVTIVSVQSIRRAAVALGAAMAIGGSGVAASHLQSVCACPWGPASIFPSDGWSRLSALVDLDTTRDRLAFKSSTNLRSSYLPSEWISFIKADGGSVDVVPHEISLIPANGLVWSPNPVLQLYSAYTTTLDRRSAEHYSGAEAPAFVLLQFADIDDRHPTMGAPATWRALLTHYEVLSVRLDHPVQVALLGKRDRPLKERGRIVGRDRFLIGDWVEVPRAGGLLFGRLALSPSTAGRFTSTVWRIPPVYIELELGNGNHGVYRFVPATAIGGLLLNRLPFSLEELTRLFAGRLRAQVVRFRIGGPGAEWFHRRVALEWVEFPWHLSG